MEEDEFLSKRLWGLALACNSLAMALFAAIELRFLKNSETINEKKIDMKLITVNDYAVEVTITQDMFNKFK